MLRGDLPAEEDCRNHRDQHRPGRRIVSVQKHSSFVQADRNACRILIAWNHLVCGLSLYSENGTAGSMAQVRSDRRQHGIMILPAGGIAGVRKNSPKNGE